MSEARFSTSLKTLTSVKGSYFDTMFSGRWPLKPESDGCFFIDRNPMVFSHVLDFLRGETINLSRLTPAERDALQKDADFYGIPLLASPSVNPGERVMCFGEHSAGIVLSESDTIATCRSGDYESDYVLGKTVFSGTDRVEYVLRIISCRIIRFGVTNKCPSKSDLSNAADLDMHMHAFFHPSFSNRVRDCADCGDTILVALDCAAPSLSVQNLSRSVRHDFPLPRCGKGWRLIVTFENKGSVCLMPM